MTYLSLLRLAAYAIPFFGVTGFIAGLLRHLFP